MKEGRKIRAEFYHDIKLCRNLNGCQIIRCSNMSSQNQKGKKAHKEPSFLHFQIRYGHVKTISITQKGQVERVSCFTCLLDHF